MQKHVKRHVRRIYPNLVSSNGSANKIFMEEKPKAILQPQLAPEVLEDSDDENNLVIGDSWESDSCHEPDSDAKKESIVATSAATKSSDNTVYSIEQNITI